MRKGASIFLLLCFCLTVLSGLGMIAHEILHLTSSFTGIHQHEVIPDKEENTKTKKLHIEHSHNHHQHQAQHVHQRHSVIDHAKLMKEIMAFSQNYKSVFSQILFFPFYYIEGTSFQGLFPLVDVEENHDEFHLNLLYRAYTPPTPPPELF